MISGPQSFAAVDLGASAGRVTLGRVNSGFMELVEVRRFENAPLRLADGLHWDLPHLYDEITMGLLDAAKWSDGPLGVGIDSWGVDYGLVDEKGELVALPFHYREDRTARAIERVESLVSRDDLYRINGLQYLPFNTIYQLVADGERLSLARRMLLIPDLLAFWLTDIPIAERTNASTTGLVDISKASWSNQLIDKLNLPRSLFMQLVEPGHIIGPVRSVAGLRSAVVSTVGSHDTASAVVAVPAFDDDCAFISCGTWSLVGVELQQAILTDESREANFTNERGLDGTIRFLRNVMGLWVLQETVRAWTAEGPMVHMEGLLNAARNLPVGGPVIDPDQSIFLPPGDMPLRIRRACQLSDQQSPETRPQLLRCILDSLAFAFARAVREASRLASRRIRTVHIVGGGSRIGLLCQLTADACNLPVVAGPAEATSMGNLVVQARTYGRLTGNLPKLREVVINSTRTKRYEPDARPNLKAATRATP